MIAIVRGRLAASAVLLLALWLLQVFLPEPWFVLLVSLSLIAAPVVCWATFYFFGRRAVARPDLLVLRIRTQDAFELAVASTGAGVLGVVGIARVLNVIPPIGPLFVVGLAFVLLMIAAPAVNWLVVWRPWTDQ